MRRLVLALVFLAACDKAATRQCDLGCRNYAKLNFWHIADAQINSSPAEQRDELRKQKQAQFDAELDKGIDLCINQCVSGAGKKRVKCWVESRTYEDLKKCDTP